MKVLNIGSMNLDYVYSLEHIVRPGETVSAKALKTVPGGKGLNQSVAFARAGAEIYHAGCFGKGGEELKKLLCDNGVNVSLISETDAPQGNAIIEVEESGNNSIIVFGGSNRCLTEAQIDEILRNFSEGDLVTLQNEVNLLSYIVKMAAEKGLKVLLNPSPFDAAIGEVDFNDLSWLVMNEVETKALTGTDDPKQAYAYLHEKYPRLSVIITLGTNGAWCFTDSEEVYQPSYKVKAADTTAAGDTFTGYMFASLANGKSVKEAMELAAKASAIGVTRPGASSSIPYMSEVIAFCG